MDLEFKKLSYLLRAELFRFNPSLLWIWNLSYLQLLENSTLVCFNPSLLWIWNLREDDALT